MNILSHRGYWKNAAEKNTESAFRRSFDMALGIETDVRDYDGRLVISHDMATSAALPLHTVLSLAERCDWPTTHRPTLALNIKADGLASALEKILAPYTTLDYFVFDMSVPDMRSYLNTRIPVFARMSEIERQPLWIERCAGVWLDSFEQEWCDASTVLALLHNQKRVCVVSPELHGRPYHALWEHLRPIVATHQHNLMLCTDYVQEAMHFFKE